MNCETLSCLLYTANIFVRVCWCLLVDCPYVKLYRVVHLCTSHEAFKTQSFECKICLNVLYNCCCCNRTTSYISLTVISGGERLVKRISVLSRVFFYNIVLRGVCNEANPLFESCRNGANFTMPQHAPAVPT